MSTLLDLEDFWNQQFEHSCREIVILEPGGKKEDIIYKNEYIHEPFEFELPKCCRRQGMNEMFQIDFAEKAI